MKSTSGLTIMNFCLEKVENKLQNRFKLSEFVGYISAEGFGHHDEIVFFPDRVQFVLKDDQCADERISSAPTTPPRTFHRLY